MLMAISVHSIDPPVWYESRGNCYDQDSYWATIMANTMYLPHAVRFAILGYVGRKVDKAGKEVRLRDHKRTKLKDSEAEIQNLFRRDHPP